MKKAMRALPPPEAAAAAGLRYTLDEGAGITRTRAGKGFTYRDVRGRTIRDAAQLGRIRSLAIPPAWTDVWISPAATGHIQATGRDAKGRKQYRYHPRWRAARDETKYQRLMAFARLLPRIRARVDRDLARDGLTREKVIATVVRLLEATLIRVGNEEYARQNRSYGLTTMRDGHASVSGERVRFRFRGKSGRDHVIDLHDRRLSRIVKRCQDLPGQQLFQYVDASGHRRAIESADVNGYLREVTGGDFTAKDFRTWSGTVLAAWALEELAPGPEEAPVKRNVVRAIESVSARLGNTVAVCRKCYVHPAVVDAYLEGSLVATLQARLGAEARRTGLPAEEARVLQLLARRLERERPAVAA
ncbi:MAG: DNA topoisomerase IB [Vicinamibacteria bacterium]